MSEEKLSRYQCRCCYCGDLFTAADRRTVVCLNCYKPCDCTQAVIGALEETLRKVDVLNISNKHTRKEVGSLRDFIDEQIRKAGEK